VARIISLLSGKGGSGKTTLALSFASMLSDCKIRTLLVDCDLSTNGATYFFEDQMSDDGYLTTFIDIALQQQELPHKPHIVNDFFDFLPAQKNLRQVDALSTYGRHGNIKSLFSYFESIKQNYDVILLDCQAGYTNLLDFIIPFSNFNLVIMEADAISSAAIRNLYLKVSSLMEQSKFYQIFNKVTSDEYEIYRKVTGGTFFTNIGTITFDWSIRKAFSLAQIPDLKNTNSEYGLQIYEICKVVFMGAKYQERLAIFNLNYSIEKIDVEMNNLKCELRDEKKTYTHNKISQRLSMMLSLLGCCVAFPIMLLLSNNQLEVFFENLTIDISMLVLIVSITVPLLFSLITSLISTWQDKKMLSSQWKIRYEQETNLHIKRESLANELERIKKKTSIV
jgi:cellulose biosynthesis protein BcsQ